MIRSALKHIKMLKSGSEIKLTICRWTGTGRYRHTGMVSSFWGVISILRSLCITNWPISQWSHPWDYCKPYVERRRGYFFTFVIKSPKKGLFNKGVYRKKGLFNKRVYSERKVKYCGKRQDCCAYAWDMYNKKLFLDVEKMHKWWWDGHSCGLSKKSTGKLRKNPLDSPKTCYGKFFGREEKMEYK